MDSHSTVSYPLVKGGAALTTLVAMEWLTTAGQICAALTAIVIFGEVLWKKVLKPLITYLRSEGAE